MRKVALSQGEYGGSVRVWVWVCVCVCVCACKGWVAKLLCEKTAYLSDLHHKETSDPQLDRKGQE